MTQESRHQRRQQQKNFRNPLYSKGYKDGYIAGVDKLIAIYSKAVERALKSTNGIGEKRSKEITNRIDAYMSVIRETGEGE